MHIPKNAGTSVRYAMREVLGMEDCLHDGWGVNEFNDSAHPLSSQIQHLHKEVWNFIVAEDVMVFSVVRNPFNRAASAYAEYLKQFDEMRVSIPTLRDYLELIKERAYLNEIDGFKFIHGAPQVDFILSKYIQSKHHIFNFEDELIEEKISRLLGATIHLPLLNQGTRYFHQLTRGDRELIRCVYKDDFLEFGYEMDSI